MKQGQKCERGSFVDAYVAHVMVEKKNAPFNKRDRGIKEFRRYPRNMYSSLELVTAAFVNFVNAGCPAHSRLNERPRALVSIPKAFFA